MDPLQQAALLYDELDSLRPFSKDDEQRIMQKFRLDWNYHSNHLEGNQLTYGETKALLLFNITAQGKPLKDHLEMTGHNEAINWIIEVLKEERPLTESFIRQIHKLLLKEPYEVKAITPEGKETTRMIQVGQYKSAPNHVKTKTGEIFRFATSEETPAMMNDLLTWYEKEKETKDKNAIILAAEFHYKFIRIHPFDDGNGRLARILMNFILMSNRYPPVVIKTEDKENYFNVLQLADAGQFTPFVDYIANNLIHSLELMIRGAKGEGIEELEDIDKEILLLSQKIKSKPRKIEVSKSRDSVLNIFDTSISKLYSTFLHRSSTFDRFFYEKVVNLYHNDSQKISGGDKFERLRKVISDYSPQVNKIRIIVYFSQAIDLDMYEFKYSMVIEIYFHQTYVFFQDSKSRQICRILYGEQLSDTEISEIIGSELKNHKEAIENYMDTQSNKNLKKPNI
ncbi:Fic family protein [uncultured Roseivirga sp.]|uniref:Fic family protein n=1 Tax=uncultured Roseivirga sp. TaxID=543088 RepID=UPI0030DCDDF1|tara:strand:+ start:119588 stop:120946 length:1359 start_codon:yes stop_codon:yes gene_type:complete